MSDFKAKMHQIRFRMGSPRLCYGRLQPSPDTLTRFKGPTSKGSEWREGKRDRREERKKRRAGERGGEVHLPHSKFLDPPLVGGVEGWGVWALWEAV